MFCESSLCSTASVDVSQSIKSCDETNRAPTAGPLCGACSACSALFSMIHINPCSKEVDEYVDGK